MCFTYVAVQMVISSENIPTDRPSIGFDQIISHYGPAKLDTELASYLTVIFGSSNQYLLTESILHFTIC